MVILLVVVAAALIVRRTIGQGASRYPKLKYFFNYNLIILVGHVIFLPLCLSIVKDLTYLGRG